MATRMRVSRAAPTPYLGEIYFPSYGKIRTAIPEAASRVAVASSLRTAARPSLNPPCPATLQLANPPMRS